MDDALTTTPCTSQLLANRIQMLKKEEQKALKKIENTKDKASLILRLREENEKRAQERIRVLQIVRHFTELIVRRRSEPITD
jgi:hypothetical protein